MKDTDSLVNHRKLFCLLIVIFCVHLLVAWLSHRGVVRDDAESYVLLGRNLAAGHGYVFAPGQTPTAWRAPGYPFLLEAIFRLTGGSLGAARCVHALLWTLAALLTYRIGRKLYRFSIFDFRFSIGPDPGSTATAVYEQTGSGIENRSSTASLLEAERREHGAALLAAGMVGLYPEFLGMTGLLWSENLFICLFLAAIDALLSLRFRWMAQSSAPNKIENRKSKIENFGPCLLTGVSIGLAILTRSTALILLPMVWFALRQGGWTRRGVGQAAFVTGIALLMVGGWTLRNRQILGRAILVESNAGYNLYVGNRPDTPIPFAWRRMDSIPRDPVYQRLTAGRSEGEAYSVLSRAAWTEIKAHPLHTLLLAGGKTFDFWLPDFFIAFNLRAGTFGPHTSFLWPLVLAATVGGYLVFWAAALRQAVQTRRQWGTQFLALILVLFTLPHALVFGASRHHLPLMPLVMLLAAPCLYALCSRKASKYNPQIAQSIPDETQRRSADDREYTRTE